MKFPHIATYWKREGRGPTGLPIFSEPQYTACRWEDKADVSISSDGEKTRTTSTVYTPDVMEKGCYMMRGRIDGPPPEGAYQIREIRAISNFRNTRTEYRALL